jgi:ABC-type uncharacterized transport system permease subunit
MLPERITSVFLSGLLILIWLIVLMSDLHHRRVPSLILLALMVVSLIGRAWPWWILTAALVLSLIDTASPSSRRWLSAQA